MSGFDFIKMHGLGNDFVVIDVRDNGLQLADDRIRAIADRRTGVGFDQMIMLETPDNGSDAEAFMRIYNADGGEVEACGNAARCVSALLMTGLGRDSVRLDTASGPISAEFTEDRQVTVDMGPAGLDWQGIPLAREMDTLHVDLTAGPLSDPVAVNMGNPHAVFFVDDVAAIDLETLGPKLEHDPLFPERANISIAQLTDENAIRLRVWERGVGITRACGTGACATAVAAARRDLTGRDVEVTLDGGSLNIDWLSSGHVLMTGPVAMSFAGHIPEGAIT